MQEIKLGTTCPHCKEELIVKTAVPTNPLELAPNVRSAIEPVGSIYVYKISSEEIKQFITQKAQSYIPDVKIEVIPRYCEKKRRRDTEPHHSYASLRIAFSDKAVVQDSDLGWYGKLGESTDNVKVVPTLFTNIIQKYQYNRKEVDKWMNNYKILEELEEGLGMTEAYISDLRLYATPRRVQTTTNESWIIFSAAAENVIRDMLTEVESDKLIGNLVIQDVYPVSKEIVEFIVYVNPTEMVLKENPHVRQILLGEEKPKK